MTEGQRFKPSLLSLSMGLNLSLRFNLTLNKGQCFLLNIRTPTTIEHKLGHFLTCYEHDLLILKLFRNEISLIFSSEIYKEQFHAHTT